MPVNLSGNEIDLISSLYLTQATNQGIVLDGLYAHYDSSIASSYPGSGSTWFDISGNSRNLAMGSGVTLANDFGGVLQFSKDANGYARISGGSFDLRSSNNTVISFVRKLSNGDDGRTIQAWDNNWLLAHHDTTYGDYYAEGWVYEGAGTSDTVWRMYTGTGNVSTDVWQLYINADLIASNSNGAQGPYGLNLNGRETQYSTCQIGTVLVYNRVLTSTEILQVFNATRKRFGV